MKIISTNIFKPHERVLKVLGLWPPKKKNIIHYLHLTIFCLIIILFLATLFTSMLFISSTKQIVDNLIVSSSSISAFLRGILFYKFNGKRIKMFKAIEKFDDGIQLNLKAEVNVMEKLRKNALLLFRVFLMCYCMACGFLGVQSLFGKRDEVFWSSTTLYPNGINENQWLYWIIFMLQAIGTSTMTILSCILDTYTFMIIMILCSYTDILAVRLNKIGNSNDFKDDQNKISKWNELSAINELKEHIKTFQLYIQ